MALIYAAEARRELVEAAAYYEEHRTGLGKEFLAEAERTAGRIVRHPQRWRRIEGRFRRCLFRRFPYSVIYTVEGGDLFVAAFMHHRRKPGYWRKRQP